MAVLRFEGKTLALDQPALSASELLSYSCIAYRHTYWKHRNHCVFLFLELGIQQGSPHCNGCVPDVRAVVQEISEQAVLCVLSSAKALGEILG